MMGTFVVKGLISKAVRLKRQHQEKVNKFTRNALWVILSKK